MTYEPANVHAIYYGPLNAFGHYSILGVDTVHLNYPTEIEDDGIPDSLGDPSIEDKGQKNDQENDQEQTTQTDSKIIIHVPSSVIVETTDPSGTIVTFSVVVLSS